VEESARLPTDFLIGKAHLSFLHPSEEDESEEVESEQGLADITGLTLLTLDAALSYIAFTTGIAFPDREGQDQKFAGNSLTGTYSHNQVGSTC
jgi:hypothetical protein